MAFELMGCSLMEFLSINSIDWVGIDISFIPSAPNLYTPFNTLFGTRTFKRECIFINAYIII